MSSSATPRSTTKCWRRRCLSRVPRARRGTLNLTITYQGCAEGGLCYNPITRNVSLELPPTNVATRAARNFALVPPALHGRGSAGAEQDQLASLIREGNLLAVLATFFGAGVLLSFTPCVLPMIPILSGIIVGQGDKVTPLRGFSLAFTYVQGMALTYAAAGADRSYSRSSRRRRLSSSSRGSSCFSAAVHRARARDVRCLQPAVAERAADAPH